jgi:hypothetical protein
VSTFAGTSKSEKQYEDHVVFGDCRDDVICARINVYENEAKCDSNMETLLFSIEALGRSAVHTCQAPAWADPWGGGHTGW